MCWPPARRPKCANSSRWAFEDAGVPIEFRGEGVDEKGYAKSDGRCLVEVDPRYFRPTEVELLIGDPPRRTEKLGWRHETTLRANWLREMVAGRPASHARRADRQGCD